MSTFETVSIAALWLIQFITMALLLLTYRQIDKAYRSGNREGAIGIEAGTRLDPIEVISSSGLEELVLSTENSVGVLALVSSDCRSCQEVLRHLASETVRDRISLEDLFIVDLNAAQISSDGMSGGVPPPLRDRYWSAGHPHDVKRQFGISSVPAMVAFSGDHVVAASSGESAEALDALLSSAHTYIDRLRHA